MSNKNPLTIESPDSYVYADEPSPYVDTRYLPDGAMMLATALENDRFTDGKATIVCPGCSEHIETHGEGLPQVLPCFAARCDDCEVELRRWSAVVVPGTFPSHMIDDGELRRFVQSYWESRFREGVEKDGLPHTREFGEECERLADAWGWDWTVTCPLCSRPRDELPRTYLGYHHWSYTEDIGTSLCDDCHDYIHGVQTDGDSKRVANQQDWRARKLLGLRDFRDISIIRLAMRDAVVHDPDVANYSRYLKQRYNIPLSEGRIEVLLTDVRCRDHVQQVLQDRGGPPELDESSESADQ